MIRFTDIVPADPPKKATKPTPERGEPAAPLLAKSTEADAPKPAKTPRKPRKSA